MTSVERYYARWGYTRFPGNLKARPEGLFSFRQRAEISTSLLTADDNPLRERLYLMWLGRDKGAVRFREHLMGMQAVVEPLMDQVMQQFATK